MGLMDFNLDDVGGVFTSIREAITGEKIKDPAEMARLAVEVQKLENALMTGQLTINAAEAAHPSIFVAGWRPSIGWIGSAALAYQFIIYPLLLWAMTAFGIDLAKAPPVLDSGPLFALVTGMLGIGTMRSFDKRSGTETRRMGK